MSGTFYSRNTGIAWCNLALAVIVPIIGWLVISLFQYLQEQEEALRADARYFVAQSIEQCQLSGRHYTVNACASETINAALELRGAKFADRVKALLSDRITTRPSST